MKKTIIILILLLAMCSGCKVVQPVIVPGEQVHDTIYQKELQHDSIVILDSLVTIITTINDTVYQTRDRWHTEYRDRYVHDSIYIAKSDTITTVVHETTNELTSWQRMEVWFGKAFLIIIAISIIIATIKYKK